MGGLLSLFSSEPSQPQWDGRRTPYNLWLDREEEYFREINQRSSSSTSASSYGVRSSDYSIGVKSSDYSIGIRSSDANHRIGSVNRNNYSYSAGNFNINNSNINRSFGNAHHVRTTAARSRTLISKSDFDRFQQILYNAVIRQSKTLNWNVTIPNDDYQLVRLSSGPEYDNILTRFSKGIQNQISVHQILRVENLYLLGQFYLKKLEYQNKCLPVEERILFHGTKSEYVDSICRDNFDWRLHGRTKGNIFGKGVSFTPKSTYANHYCDRKGEKVMIVAKVLISRICAGNEHMTIPDYYDRSRLLRFDTSIKQPKKDVLVKYCDDEFYPAYLIYYTGKIFYPNKGFSR